MTAPRSPGAAVPNPSFTAEDLAFLRTILDVPEDRNTWLIYADWLDDRGDPRAEFLRLMVERSLQADGDPARAAVDSRLARLRDDLDPRWMMMFDPAPVAYCAATASRRCGHRWTDMIPTDVPDIRRCRYFECQRAVVYCHTADEARQFASCGQTVVLSTRVAAAELAGDPALQPPPPPPEDDYDEYELTLDEFMDGRPPDAPRAPAEPPRPWWRFW